MIEEEKPSDDTEIWTVVAGKFRKGPKWILFYKDDIGVILVYQFILVEEISSFYS